MQSYRFCAGNSESAPALVITPAYRMPGSSIQLTVSGAVTYQWSPSTGLSSTTGANPFATPLASTTYTVIGSDAIGCSSTATTRIIVSPNRRLSATNNPVCEIGTTISQQLAGFRINIFMVSGRIYNIFNNCSGRIYFYLFVAGYGP